MIEDLSRLRELARWLGQTMPRLHAVPQAEWAEFRARLLAADNELAWGMQRAGVTLEALGWTVAGRGCEWRRSREGPGG